MKYKKTLLPSGWYHVTIQKAEDFHGALRIVFTIDRGEHAYRNVIMYFPLNEFGMDKLSNLFLGMNFVVITDPDSKLFYEQFTNQKLRAEANIDRRIADDVVKNYIIELRPPVQPEDYNVLKPKTDEFYQKRNSGKELPIKSGSSTDGDK